MGKKSKKRQRRSAEKKHVATAGAAEDRLVGYEAIGRQKHLLYMGLIAVVALAIRLLYFYINKTQNPLFYHPILDARFHSDWATAIISGDFWGDDVFFRAPLYPYLLAFIYKISGSSMAFAVFVQHVVGSVTCILVYLLARQFFAARIALLAGLLAALYWPLIYFEGDLLIVTLIVALDILALLTLTLALKRSDGRLFFVCGLVTGLSAIARPSILIFAIVVPLGLYLTTTRRGKPERDHRWLRRSVLVMAGIAVVVMPVIVRNYVVGRDVVPIASQGGVNFYIGNNPSANGTEARVPGARADLYGTYQGAIELAEQDLGRSLKPSEVSNYYFKKGVQFLLSSPEDAFALTLKKLYLFWAAIERSNSKYIQFFWREFGLGKVPLPGFWLVGPLGLLGGFLLWGRRRDLVFLYLFVISYSIGVIVFFVNGRFRLPVVPVLIIFSSYSLMYLYSALRKHRRLLPKALIVLVICVVVVDYDYVRFRGVRSLDEAATYLALGNAYMEQNRKSAALSAYEQAYSIQQRYPTQGYRQIAGTVDYQLGVLYNEKGYASRAVDALERIAPRDPRSLPANQLLAPLYEQLGRTGDAIRANQSIVAADPGASGALLALARLYRRAGDLEQSQQYIDRLRSTHANDPAIEEEIRRIESNP